MERWRKRYSPSCHQELHVANNDASSRASTRTSNKGYRRALVLREHLHPLRASISICIVYVCACEVLMPFEVKRKCSIPRVSLFLPPHRINIGSLSCRCIRIPCDEAARDAIRRQSCRVAAISRGGRKRGRRWPDTRTRAFRWTSTGGSAVSCTTVRPLTAPAGTRRARDLSGPRGPRDISCASYNSANRTTKSRNLAISRPPPGRYRGTHRTRSNDW